VPTNHRHLCLRALFACLLVILAIPAASSAVTTSDNGGAAYTPPPPPAAKAKIVNGIAIPPASAPKRVKKAIAAANRIVTKPYVYGGGHKPYSQIWKTLDRGYDCSGTVSHALYGGKFLTSPLDSGSFMAWGERGVGRWITVYTNPGHAYVVIAGLRLDTSTGGRVHTADVPGKGPRWRNLSRTSAGFTARHPAGF
jgi:hypothetical protein